MSIERTLKFSVKDISFINDMRNIAVIGPSQKDNFFFLRSHQENFKGDNIFVVHPNIKEIPDFDDGTKGKIFKSVKDIPVPIDYVFITVPPSQILTIMEDCAKKGVKLASIFTAKFSESGTKEGVDLERDLLKKAQNKVRILGPNCMGFYYPKLGIAWRPKFPSTLGGNIGFIAQSGGMCNIAIYMANELGIKFSKVFSFGNGADLDLVDLLYFLSNDPETNIILVYVEGIKKGRGKLLKEILAQNKKPIIFLKGGKTETGSIAAKTHTASLTGESRVWNTILSKQYNAIEVDSLEQLLFAAKIIDCYGTFELNNVAVFSISGGYGVVLVDLIEREGMKVPPFSSEIQKQIDSKFFKLGTSSKNPLDVSAQIYYSKIMCEVIDLALSDNKIDGLIMDLPTWYFSLDFQLKKDYTFEPNMIEALSLGHKHRKPLFAIIQRVNCPEDRARVFQKLNERKVPVFGDPLEFIPLLPKISKFANKIKNNL